MEIIASTCPSPATSSRCIDAQVRSKETASPAALRFERLATVLRIILAGDPLLERDRYLSASVNHEDFERRLRQWEERDRRGVVLPPVY